jgi:hypothetical protein
MLTHADQVILSTFIIECLDCGKKYRLMPTNNYGEIECANESCKSSLVFYKREIDKITNS